MPNNELIDEFVRSNTNELACRMTELFDSLLNETDELATESIKSELHTILEERIDALDEN